MLDFASILIGITALINVFLAIWTYYKRKDNSSLLWFSSFVFSLIVWCIAILGTHLTRAPEQAIIWGRLIYGSGLLIATSLFIFANVFPRTKYKLSSKLKLIALVPLAILFPITLFTNSIIKEAQIPIQGEAMAHFGPIYPIYLLYMIGFLIAALYLLFRTYRCLEGSDKIQALYVFLGILFTVLVGGTTNLILPSLGYFKLWAVMGPASTLFVIFFVLYAVLRHRFFGLKVIGIEILAGLIVLIFLIDTLLSKSLLEIFIRIPLFIAVALFAYLLIHGTFKQIAASRKIQIQAQELEKANISLKELLSMKTEFLNTVSHQLRTPTTIFRSMLSMITEGSVSPKEKEQWINDCYGAANRLLIIIEGILEANTFEGRTPAFDFKLCDLEQILQELIKNVFKNMADKKGLELKVETPKEKLPQIMADAKWLRSALIKVIDNAIWYTRKDGEVIVSTEYNKDQNRISIKVQDTGIGLTPEDKELLFQKFKRGRGSWGMNVNSSGLGLYITKKIIEGHHGQITAQSEGEDKGSTFTITLPVMQEI